MDNLEYSKITLFFRQKQVQKAYRRMWISTTYGDVKGLMPFVIIAVTAHLIWSMFSSQEVKGFVPKLVVTVFVVAGSLLSLCSKRLFIVVGYVFVSFTFLMYSYNVEMDAIEAARVYMIISNIMGNFVVYA